MFLINACGEAPPDGDVLESTSRSLDQSCRNATPAQIFQGRADVLSPTTYNQCFKGYVVQVNNLQRGGTGGVGVDPRVSFSMGTGGIGMTQTECEQSWVGGYVFEQQPDGTFATIDVLSSRGSWFPVSGSGGVTGRCETVATGVTVAEGGTYKLAASARTAQTTQAPTRAVRIRAPR
jgi:hypothetical protein